MSYFRHLTISHCILNERLNQSINIIYIAHLKQQQLNKVLYMSKNDSNRHNTQQYPSLINVPKARGNCMPQSKGVFSTWI